MIQTQYRADGFYIVPEPVIPLDVVTRAVAGMDAIREGRYDTGCPPEKSRWSPGDDPNALCKIEMPQIASRAVFDLISHPALGEWAARVTGACTVQVWWVQLLYKPVYVETQATNIGWHQDRNYWGIWEEGSDLFTAWVALSDVTPAAGPMQFARGSNHWGLRDPGGFYEQDLETQQRAIPIPEGRTWDLVPAILAPGGVSFHDCMTFHGSGPNRSNAPRRSFAIHMRTENSRPVNDKREGLARHIDDPSKCPVIYVKK